MHHATQYITLLFRNGYTYIPPVTKINLPAGSEANSGGLTNNVTTLSVFPGKLRISCWKSSRNFMQHEWILLALSVIGLHTFIKTGESPLNKLVPLRSTLNTGTLSFPFLLNLFGAWPCISLQAFVCFPCCPQPEDTICCSSFHQQSAIPQPEVRSSRFWLYRRNPFPSNPRVLRHVVLRPFYVSSTWSTMAKNTC